METSGVYFGSLKTSILYVELENIRIGTSLNILVTQNSKTLGVRGTLSFNLHQVRVIFKHIFVGLSSAPYMLCFENRTRFFHHA